MSLSLDQLSHLNLSYPGLEPSGEHIAISMCQLGTRCSVSDFRQERHTARVGVIFAVGVGKTPGDLSVGPSCPKFASAYDRSYHLTIPRH
jgi:hypothetical protein